ncbi:OmpA family protein [Streptosporangium sp. KLBMP 9127]|nr:OmpA family protein [Streptosporangium sp. KLBMP 9127]
MSRSPDRLPPRATARPPGHRAARGLALALAVGVSVGLAPPAWADPTPAPPPPGDAVGVVEDIIGRVEDVSLTVESLDSSESETRDDQTVTVTLTSDVLFALDKADVTAKARARLATVAKKIETDSAGGVVKIAGHTDDQGEDAYNVRLSQRRADAVRDALAKSLAGQGVTFQATGHGEGDPRVPNLVGDKPSEKNRALNRRVEIVYNVS